MGAREVKATTSYAERKHLNADNRGSDKKTHRVFCKDCCQVIDALPQDGHKLHPGMAVSVP